MDDLGAIVIIAFFYTSHLIVTNLLISLGIFCLLLVLNRLKVKPVFPYLFGGIFMWYFMLQSGVHATITGVLLAFAIPFQNGEEDSTSYKLQHFLHKPVAFFILPLFALANTAVMFDAQWLSNLSLPNNVGVLVGLVLGKPLGILLFTLLALFIGVSTLPSELNWKHILGAGLLGGIGFTMSIFITLLAFDNPQLITSTKIAILLASVLSGLIGFLWLKFVLKKSINN